MDTGQRKGSLWARLKQRSALDAGNREGPLWVRANTRDALGAYKLEGIRADVKERFGHGQTLKDACEGALWKRKTLKVPLRSNTETYEWYFLLIRQVSRLCTVAFGRCFGTVCTGWRFPMSVIWQYAAFCLTALQQINTSDRNKAHFSNSALLF